MVKGQHMVIANLINGLIFISSNSTSKILCATLFMEKLFLFFGSIKYQTYVSLELEDLRKSTKPFSNPWDYI